MLDYNTWLELDHKQYKLNETVTCTNRLKTKLKIRNTKLYLNPGETKTLIRTKKGWKFE